MPKFPASQKKQQPAPAPATPARQSDQPRGDRFPFLKPKDIRAEGDTQVCFLTPIRLYTGGTYGTQLICHVVLDNETEFDWSIKVGGQQFMRLEKSFGKDLTQWPNKVAVVYRDKFNENEYVAAREA